MLLSASIVKNMVVVSFESLVLHAGKPAWTGRARAIRRRG